MLSAFWDGSECWPLSHGLRGVLCERREATIQLSRKRFADHELRVTNHESSHWRCRMPDLRVKFCGIESPNPFWLASGPPTNTAGQVMRAFDAGWGGAVWKTIGEPIVNTSSRYGAIDYNGTKVMGFNNIELISDRPVETNFREIADVKKRYPKNLVIASLMVESKRETWHDIVRRSEDSGSDALELNFGCPHGMSERGMGSAVGQVPEYTEMITSWVKEAAKTPVIV